MKQPEALRLADAYADASFEQGLNQRTADPAPELAREALAAELRRLSAIEQAAQNLVKVKGRFHTEQAFNQLKELLK